MSLSKQAEILPRGNHDSQWKWPSKPICYTISTICETPGYHNFEGQIVVDQSTTCGSNGHPIYTIIGDEYRLLGGDNANCFQEDNLSAPFASGSFNYEYTKFGSSDPITYSYSGFSGHIKRGSQNDKGGCSVTKNHRSPAPAKWSWNRCECPSNPHGSTTTTTCTKTTTTTTSSQPATTTSTTKCTT